MPLRFMPADKMVVLGLVISQEVAVESRDYLRERIEEASQSVPLERLALSPQCGFASTAAGNRLTAADSGASRSWRGWWRGGLERLVRVNC